MGIFEIIGPPMIGPSSSHTAGACRMGWVAGRLLGETPRRAFVELHGSFLATGDGHGTKEALIAGLLGMEPDDENLIHSGEFAEAQNLETIFSPADLGPQAHPNSVRIRLDGATRSLLLQASSIGGGSICLETIDDLPFGISGTLETLFLWHQDTSGFLARITAVLACVQVNVASIRTSRRDRGDNALTALEVDGRVPEEVMALFRKMPTIARLVLLPPLPGV